MNCLLASGRVHASCVLARMFSITGTPMKGWVTVGSEGVEDDDPLPDWIERAAKFVRTLPGKSKE